MVGDIQAAGQGHWSAVLASHHVEPANKTAGVDLNNINKKKLNTSTQLPDPFPPPQKKGGGNVKIRTVWLQLRTTAFRS